MLDKSLTEKMKKTLIKTISIAALCSTTVMAKTSQSETFPLPLVHVPTQKPFSQFIFLVDKSKRLMRVYETQSNGITLIDEHPTDIGKNDGNKTKRDDHKTPEGIYFLQKKLTQPEIPFDTYGEIAFTTDYPNFFDRFDSKTGSGIWLHAIPDKVPLTRGSRGCVVVRNNVIKKLQNIIELEKTPLIIYNQIEDIDAAKREVNYAEVQKFLKDWTAAWQSQNPEEYLKYYSEKFTAPQFNYKSWSKHKRNLAKQYEFIKVELSEPLVLIHDDQLVIRTIQKYESNMHKDTGMKTIYALKEETQYRIIREEWVAEPEPQISVQAQTL